MLWIEFLRNHRKYDDVLWHAWIGAVLCPVLMSGAIELLQEYCTTYRGGDWFDFLANICGVTLATLFSYFVLRPWIMKRRLVFISLCIYPFVVGLPTRSRHLMNLIEEVD